MMRRGAVLAPLMFLVGVVGQGCGFALDGAPTLDVLNQCGSDSDCSGGSCDTTLGLCVAPNPASFPLGVRITPVPESTGLTAVPRHVEGSDFDVTLAGGGTLDIVIPGIITVVGDLCEVRADGTCGPRVAANLTFTEDPTTASGGPAPTSTILGNTETTAITGTSRMEALDGQLADFSIRLLRGREYQVLVQPVDEDAGRLYPLRRRIRVPEEGDITRISFKEWADRDVLDGRMVTESDAPVPGLRVVAVDRQTGESVSSTSVSDENGLFSLTITPEIDDYLVSIRANDSSDSQGPPLPSLLQDPMNFFPTTGVQRILIPTTEPVQVTGLVRVPGAGPVHEAVVRFESAAPIDFATGQQGEFQTRVTTNERGEFTARLVPGEYQVVVTPPAGREDAGVLVITRDYSATAEPEEWVLPARAVVSGAVTSFSEKTMSEVRVLLSALRLWQMDVPAAGYNRSNDAITGVGGQFSVPVDHGRYDVTVRPPQESGFAWWVAADRAIGSGSSELEIELAPPVSVAGVIRDESGAPIPEAELEAFALVPVGGSTATETRWIPVGRTTSSSDGSYVLLLPASIE